MLYPIIFDDNIITIPKFINTVTIRPRATRLGELQELDVAQMPDPEVSAEVAQQVVLFLKDYIKAYRTDKARENLEFIKGRHEEARERFETAQRRLAEFTDRHRGTMKAVTEIEMQRLQREYDLAFNLYNTIAEHLLESCISSQE